MKFDAISGDLAVKLALGVVVLGAAGYAVYKAKNIAGDAVAWASDHLDPTSANNVAYQTINAAFGSILPSNDSVVPGNPGIAGRSADGSWSVGSYIYDISHRDPVTGKFYFWQF